MKNEDKWLANYKALKAYIDEHHHLPPKDAHLGAKFVYSIMLSYHLISLLHEVKHNFINYYGSDPILVERPLKANKQKRQTFFIVPKVDTAYSDGKHIWFDFVRKGEGMSQAQ